VQRRSSPRPNFFIVGAPKCGTTSMYEYLAQHPAVFMSPRKEPRHFSPDLDSGSALDGRWFTRDTDEYLAYFRGARDEAIVGEASVGYLQSTESARLIRDFEPDARILIMLRDPVDMIQARHRQRVWSQREDLTDLGEAIAAEPDRKAGRRVPPGATHIKGYQYRESCTMTPQVRRYLDVFGADRVRVVLLEGMARDPLHEYRAVLEFLGVDPGFVPPRMGVFNRSKVPRSSRLRRLFQPLRGVRRRLKLVLPAAAQQAIALPLRFRRLNVRETPRAPLPAELESELIRYFASDVSALGALLGRDLAAVWPRFAEHAAASATNPLPSPGSQPAAGSP
jgi:hypothetical protein